MPTPFSGCHAKLDRAREHLDSLAKAQAAYFDGGPSGRPFSVTGRFDAETRVYSFIASVHREPPQRIGAILGDLVHNLRSALDHLVWQLVILNGEDPETLTKPRPAFPNVTRAEHWRSARSGLLRGVSDATADRIRDMQPFVTHSNTPGNAPLNRLHDLWNQDKHRIVVTVAAALEAQDGMTYGRSPASADTQAIPIRDVEAVHGVWAYSGVPLNGHAVAEAHITPSGPDPLMELEGKSRAGLVFADRSPVNFVVQDMAVAVQDAILELGGPPD